jgi:branched-chain amino acid transport system ATP-binding protein
MLVIARALLTRPRLVLVDEPSLGLAPRIIDQVYEILIDLRRREGLTLLINEQSSDRVLKFADRIYVLRSGRVQLHDRAVNLREGNAIMSAYFGFEDRPAASATQSVSR